MGKKKEHYEINLERQLGKSVAPEEGDLFSLKIRGRGYFFGRVVDAAVKMKAWRPVLCYLYKVESATPTCDRELAVGELLVAPQLADPECWSAGYFRLVKRGHFGSGGILKQHCFWDSIRNRPVDKEGNPIAKKSEPCGLYGMSPVWGINYDVSEALGLPLPPEDED